MIEVEAWGLPLCICIIEIILVLPLMMEACRYACGPNTLYFPFTHLLMYMAYYGVICPKWYIIHIGEPRLKNQLKTKPTFWIYFAQQKRPKYYKNDKMCITSKPLHVSSRNLYWSKRSWQWACTQIFIAIRNTVFEILYDMRILPTLLSQRKTEIP